MKHFECNECGNLVATVNFSGRAMQCCSRPMAEVVPKSTEGHEKHTPSISINGADVTVRVGTEDNMHPMDKEHHITWVCLVTNDGSYRKLLPKTKNAIARFKLAPNERVIRAFAFCNKHGVWVSECESCREKQ